jgi:Ca2+-binding EF-hand superfamily protein
MACKGNTKRFDISYFLKSTKFDELQIRSIYNYFLSFANEEQYIQFNDFKRSLGVLGAKSHDFISKRIFTLIDIQNSSEVNLS